MPDAATGFFFLCLSLRFHGAADRLFLRFSFADAITGSWSLRMIVSDWGFELASIAAVDGPVVVATASDDVVCAPQM